MKSVLEQMTRLLSPEDRRAFEALSIRLSEVKGDIAKLSQEDKDLIGSMERKYGEQIKDTHAEATKSLDEDTLFSQPFAQHVRQILARDLGNEHPQEEEAVAFAFSTKWLPLECQREELAANWFSRFEDDIRELNNWRDELVNVNEDKKMAVGLAWFMVIFQLNKRLNG